MQRNRLAPSAKSRHRYAIGVDYGTNSVRSLVVDIDSGNEVATAVYDYPSGDKGVILRSGDNNLARQNPRDYIDGFVKSITAALRAAKKCLTGFDPSNVIGIGFDTTGSTPIPVDRSGMPLSFNKTFANNPNAMAWLWKDHTSWEEASRISELAKKEGKPYLTKCGGTYSSEWFWAKIAHCRKVDPKVFSAAFSWVELCDFIPAWVCGNAGPLTLKRSVCAAGHKAMFHHAWGGLPDKNFLAKIHPDLASLRDRLYGHAWPSDQTAGFLDAKIAAEVGLPSGLPVAVGAFDCHHGAVAAGVKPGVLVKVIGTSTCDVTVTPDNGKLADIPGVCGLVPGSVVPGMIGIEAGQSAVGDIFNWFVSNLASSADADSHKKLTAAAAKLKPGQSGLLALDWNNGNRTILVDPRLTGLLVGMTLHTSAAEAYRAMIEGTAFGARTIIERMAEYGVKVNAVVACGGVAEKNPLLMQIYADILGRPMHRSASGQACALGAAMFGAVASGAYASVSVAQKRMSRWKADSYRPNPSAVKTYDRLYAQYRRLHDGFGGVSGGGDVSRVMKDLLSIKDSVCATNSKRQTRPTK